MASNSNTKPATKSSRFLSWVCGSSSARPAQDGQGEETKTKMERHSDIGNTRDERHQALPLPGAGLTQASLSVSSFSSSSSSTASTSTTSTTTTTAQQVHVYTSHLVASPAQTRRGPSESLQVPESLEAAHLSPTLRARRSPLPESRLRPEGFYEKDGSPAGSPSASSPQLSPAYRARRRSSVGVSPLARSLLTSPKPSRTPLPDISEDIQQLSLEEKKEKKKDQPALRVADLTRSAEVPRRKCAQSVAAEVPTSHRARSNSFSEVPVATSAADDDFNVFASSLFARFRSDMASHGLGHLLATPSNEFKLRGEEPVELPDPCPLYVVWYQRSCSIAPHHWALVAAPDEKEESRAMVYQLLRHPLPTEINQFIYNDRAMQLVGKRGSSAYEGRYLVGYLTGDGQELLTSTGAEMCADINGKNKEGAALNCQDWTRRMLQGLIETGNIYGVNEESDYFVMDTPVAQVLATVPS